MILEATVEFKRDDVLLPLDFANRKCSYVAAEAANWRII